MNESIDDFDPGLSVQASEDVPFKEAAMLVRKWWYPSKENPRCVVDAIHLTRAEPTRNGVRVTARLHLIARMMPAQVGFGVHAEGRVSCVLEGPDIEAALSLIESGVDPLRVRFDSDAAFADALLLHVADLASLYQRHAIDEMAGLGQCERPAPRR